MLLITLTSCIKSDDTKTTISGFLAAVENEEYAIAVTKFHPERKPDLESFFVAIENDKGVDFQEGISIKRYTGFESSAYNSDVDGSLYSTTAEIKIGTVEGTFSVEIVDNDAGYGIYNITIDIDKQ